MAFKDKKREREYQAQYIKNNKEQRKKYNKEYNLKNRATINAYKRKWRAEMWLSLVELKRASHCIDCKISGRDNPEILDFDHRPGELKRFIIGRAIGIGSKKQLREELLKCDVVCSNCHRIRTKKRKSSNVYDSKRFTWKVDVQ